MGKVKAAVTAAKFKPYPDEKVRHTHPDFDLEMFEEMRRDRFEHMLGLFEEAGRRGVEFIGTHEYAVLGVTGFDDWQERVDPIPGPTIERFADIARRHSMHAVVNLQERDGDRLYATSALLGPKGELIGKYRKVHIPPPARMRMSGGDGFPVFQTEIGRIGFSVCYDIMFPETIRCAALNGADIVVHSGNTSYTYRDCYPRVRAAENMLWLMNCYFHGETRSCQPGGRPVPLRSEIIDPHGIVIAESDGADELVIAEIDPQMERMMPGDNAWGNRSLRGRMTRERVPAAYRVLVDENPPLLERYAEDTFPSTEEMLEIYRRKKQGG